ncbi:MAG TPA: protein phosphatase 2C domain-containing protein [Anaerolineaceae bacterium]|nr:protein phosphatase 2C domain-containing protein [Anaerolineaceae bacterium]
MILNKWFGKKETPADTKPNLLAEGLHQPPFLYAISESANGKTRDKNEDTIFTFSSRDPEPKWVGALGLYIVADGMGGHVHGELASKTAVETVKAYLMTHLLEPLLAEKVEAEDSFIENAINQAILEAQDAVLSKAQGSGTTLTLLLIADTMAYFGHVGDSRLYVDTRSEGLRCLTVDHSLVRRLVDLGQIESSAARDHPQRNILFRALGQGEGFKVDLGKLKLSEATVFMLCSDGLWGLVEQNVLARYLRPGRQNAETASRLVALANEAGGTDNISAIVISVS